MDHNFYSSPDIIRMIKCRGMRWAGHVACLREMRSEYKILVGKPEGNRSFVIPRRRWENNIKMHIWEMAFGVWIGFM
jgi:hypothetical protein